MSISCPQCSASMPETAAFCPECGQTALPAERAHGRVGVLPETLAGALAYFLLPAIAFLVIEPYKKNRFVRFHSLQCIGLCLIGVVLAALLRVAGFALFFIPTLGRLLILLVSMVVTLAFVVVWVVLIVKAFQGEMLALPGVGHFAEQQAAAK